mmetsp:Transcript_21814/g.77669  ORF Transcript_21814/g.77669 Transcript_21814/m.77669 type:complete len:390 (-) Transcript_21814:504-1673(-)
MHSSSISSDRSSFMAAKAASSASSPSSDPSLSELSSEPSSSSSSPAPEPRRGLWASSGLPSSMTAKRSSPSFGASPTVSSAAKASAAASAGSSLVRTRQRRSSLAFAFFKQRKTLLAFSASRRISTFFSRRNLFWSRNEASSARSAAANASACASTTTFVLAMFVIFVAREAHRNVFADSSESSEFGDAHAIMHVIADPPKESAKTRVSAESRYGTCRPTSASPLRSPSSTRRAMTLPSASSDLLMPMPSLSRSPVAPVRLALSDPARSTRRVQLVTTKSSKSSSGLAPPPGNTSTPSHHPRGLGKASEWRWHSLVRFKVKTAWDREDAAFARVGAVARLFAPTSSKAKASARVRTCTCVSCGTCAPWSGCSRTRKGFPVGIKRSRTDS